VVLFSLKRFVVVIFLAEQGLAHRTVSGKDGVYQQRSWFAV